MKNLWTPWRMEHIQNRKPLDRDCLFDLPGDTVSIREELLLYRDTQVVVMLNRFPHTNGHLLVAPRRHIGSLSDLKPAQSSALMEMIKIATNILTKHLAPDGFNIGCNIGECAGAGIPDHLHFHIVPRWDGDHNFLSVLAGVRSVPEYLQTTFDKLQPDFIQSSLSEKNT